jgi:hypothetical protein
VTRPIIVLTIIAGALAYVVSGSLVTALTAALIWPVAVLAGALTAIAADRIADRRIKQYRQNGGG